MGFWYNSVSSRKERARKGTDNDLNGVGPWAIALCMPCKLCTVINTDEALETCGARQRSVLPGTLAIFLYPLISTSFLAELEPHSGAPDFTHFIYIILFQKPFHQSKLPFSFILSSPFSFPPFPSLLCSTGNLPRARKAKTELVSTGHLAGNKHQAAL